jgi:hypothetical protein
VEQKSHSGVDIICSCAKYLLGTALPASLVWINLAMGKLSLPAAARAIGARAIGARVIGARAISARATAAG